MIQPTNFHPNVETKSDNPYMKNMKAEDSQKLGLQEFNQYVDMLRSNKVDVEVCIQKNPDAPDSIFLNNWFSTHKNENFPDGLLIVYPVKAVNRRLERDAEIIEKLRKEYAAFEDLSYLENQGEFLESTGCLIFDHNNLKIYRSYSERATEKATAVFIDTINKYSKKPYRLIAFRAFDLNDRPIYHTNCMMAILEHHAVICLNSITNHKDREMVKACLEENRKIIDLSHRQVEQFCGNIINVKNSEDKTVLLMSSTAKKAYSKRQIETFNKHYPIILAPKINVIEEVGGGSARCLVAELF